MTNQELLEAIAPYFPHEVKCLHSDAERGINQVCTIEELSKDEATLLSNEYEYFVNIDDVNLILRPLSDLTKPCLEGGKVPIEELAKIHIGYDVKNGDKNIQIDYKYSRVIRVNITWDHPIGCGEKLHSDDLNVRTVQVHLNSYWVIQQLYKWHFDILGLIEKGYAVDINTLNQ